MGVLSSDAPGRSPLFLYRVCLLIPRKRQPPLEGINAFCREISNVYTWYTCRPMVELLFWVMSQSLFWGCPGSVSGFTLYST